MKQDQLDLPRLLRLGLIADDVMTEPSYVIDEQQWKTSDAADWTGHLARQLGLTRTWEAHLHPTLLVILETLVDEWRGWPRAEHLRDPKFWLPFATTATKDLTREEAWTMALGWQNWDPKLPAGRMSTQLPALRAELAKHLASKLTGILDQWHRWKLSAVGDVVERRWAARRDPEVIPLDRPAPDPVAQPGAAVRAERDLARARFNKSPYLHRPTAPSTER